MSQRQLHAQVVILVKKLGLLKGPQSPFRVTSHASRHNHWRSPDVVDVVTGPVQAASDGGSVGFGSKAVPHKLSMKTIRCSIDQLVCFPVGSLEIGDPIRVLEATLTQFHIEKLYKVVIRRSMGDCCEKDYLGERLARASHAARGRAPTTAHFAAAAA
jgi:hypothetical protein